MLVFFGIYAFNNPDGYTSDHGCYVYKIAGAQFVTSIDVPDALDAYDYMNVGM